MANTNFVDSQTPVVASWLNDVNDFVYQGIFPPGVVFPSSGVTYTPAGTGAVNTTVQAKLRESVSVKDFGAVGNGTTDDTIAIQAAIDASDSVFFPEGTYKITSEITLNSNNVLFGAGQGATTLLFYKASNPASSEFMLAARYKSNITIQDMTVKSNAYADGLFDVGTYYAGPPKRYVGGDAGKINGILISSCSNVTVQNCEITGFNYDGIRVSVEGNNTNTDYNKNLKFDKLYGHHCLTTPLDILGTIGYTVTNCTMTDNGHYNASYIDGSTGYGIVLGRYVSASQLPSRSGICANNYCARNVRHGIDAHSAVDILITDNICEDNLCMGIGVLDYSGSVDDTTGAVVVQNNLIKHTVWVVSQYPLLTYRDDSTERDDSLGIYVSGFSNLILDAIIQNNTIKDLRYRQLTANTATDLIGSIFCSGAASAVVRGNHVDSFQTNYYPSICLDIAAPRIEVTDNYLRGYQRSTISKEYFRFNAGGGSGVGIISGNHLQVIGAYSDSSGTQAAYPLMRKIAGSLTFTSNSVFQTSQGTRGGIWYSTDTNKKYGFNGILSVNRGNVLYPDGVTAIEYASRIKGSLTLYITDAGSGRYDGLSSGNSFEGSSAASVLAILNDMPHCESGMVIMINQDQLDWGSDAGITIPTWQDNITFRGLSSETSNSMTKTGGIKTTGNNLITCPERSQNINFEYLYLKSAGTSVVYSPANMISCGVEGTGSGTIGAYCVYKSSYLHNNRFKGSGSGIGIAISAQLGSRIVSHVNDSDATQFAYGLNANSAAVYKNSTQPTGATSNELAQNGGTIA